MSWPFKTRRRRHRHRISRRDVRCRSFRDGKWIRRAARRACASLSNATSTIVTSRASGRRRFRITSTPIRTGRKSARWLPRTGAIWTWFFHRANSMRATSLQFAFASTLVSLCATAHGSSLFMGAYPSQVLVFDDSKEQMETRIPLITGLPNSLSLSLDKKTIYVTTNDHDGIEVIDVATRKVTNHFVLDTPTIKYRLNGVTADPTGKFLYGVTTQINKLADHFEVGRPRYTVIDVAAQKIAKTYEIEKEDLPGNTGFFGRFGFEVSPDGKYLYQFR